MTLRFGKLCAVLGVTALATTSLFAGTYFVTSTADSGNGTLRQAILNANAGGGGNIIFSNTTGLITLGSVLPVISANVNILGPGTNLLTVSGSNACMIFGIIAGTTNTFSSFTIANAYAESELLDVGGRMDLVSYPGTAISNRGSLTVTGCVISNCINFDGWGGDVGGAVYSTGSLVMQDCLFIKCGSDDYDSGVLGGCIYNTGNLAMTNCCLTNCQASEGMGICTSGTAVLDHCQLLDLNADDSEGNGGAIYGGGATLISCLFSNCQAGWEGGAFLGGGLIASNTAFVRCGSGFEGGGFYIFGSNFFYNCTIEGCGAGEYGGGGGKNFGNTTFVNCTLSDNDEEDYDGGAIFNLGTIYMTNCTVSGNISGYTNETNNGGGAILNSTYDPSSEETFTNVAIYLVDCTIVSNTAGAGPGGGIENMAGAVVYAEDTIIANNSSNDVSGILTSGGYNLIKNTNGCTITGTTTGNIYGQDPMLGPLQNNGGFTMTYALLPGSPCINAGPPDAPPYFDQRGVVRPQGPADDIGSFEFGGVPPPALIALAAGAGGCFQINFSGLPGFTYVLQRATSPAGPWNALNNVTAGPNGFVSCADSNPPAGSAFYRAVAQSQ